MPSIGQMTSIVPPAAPSIKVDDESLPNNLNEDSTDNESPSDGNSPL